MKHWEELRDVCTGFAVALWPLVGEDVFDHRRVKELVLKDDALEAARQAFYTRSCWKGTDKTTLRLPQYRGQGVRRVINEVSFGWEYYIEGGIYQVRNTQTEPGGKRLFRFVLVGLE